MTYINTNDYLDDFISEYINNLIIKQNTGVTPDLQNLFTKKEYYELLSPVIELLKTSKDESITYLRQELFSRSNILENVSTIVNEGLTSGVEITLSTPNYKQNIIYGNTQDYIRNSSGVFVPSPVAMQGDTIFDLASVTKLFTSLAVMTLLEDNEDFSLDDELVKYCPQFKYLSGVTIYDLLTFRVPLMSDGRIDEAKDYEEACSRLFNMKVNLKSAILTPNISPYSDMGAMALKFVVESYTKTNFYTYIKERILDKLSMKDTNVIVPVEDLKRCVNTDYAGTINASGELKIRPAHGVGNIYDDKARIMQQGPNGHQELSGHAGLFSTISDMSKLANALVEGTIIEENLRNEMATNRTGRTYIDSNGNLSLRNYFGYLVYSKHPLSKAELWAPVSGRSLASAGWLGNYLGIDPLNGTSIFIGANKANARLTQISQSQKDLLITKPNGISGINIDNNYFMVNSSRYAWVKDDLLVRPCTKLLLQYRMLEDFYQLKNNLFEESTINLNQQKNIAK